MNNDAAVLIFVIVFLTVWAVFAFRHWVRAHPGVKAPESPDGEILRGEAVDFLTEQGYEVTHGKWKINIGVYVDDEELGSSLFVDYFAKRDGKSYVVKIAKERKPLNLSAGSAVREQLLPYALLYEDTAGVLYVDLTARKAHQIRFELEL